MSYKDTPQQLNFYATVPETGSFALRARAGCGKTSSLKGWAQRSKKSGIATSQSKSTVTELADKMGPRFPAKTQHALCLAALKSSGRSIKLDTSKMYNIVKRLSEDNDIPFELQGEIRSLATFAKTYGIQPDPAGPAGITPNEHNVWEDLSDMYDIEFTDEILYWAKLAVIASNQSFIKDGLIDFDDMLYCALIYPHRFTKVGIIIADEVQDFNILQHNVLKRCLMPGGRIIAAGDDRQAIYAFRGALADSYQNLVSTFNMQELPLTVSFRCPSEVIKVAREYVPDIEAAPGCKQGAVLYPSSMSLREVPKTVLCCNNAPLMRLALKLLVGGRTVEIAGKDIGQGLIKLTERVTKKNLSSPEFIERLERWRDREVTKYPKRRSSIFEKFLALKTLAQSHKDVEGIKKHLGKLYPDTKDKSYRPADVHLSTIHKAKGREWNDVLLLDSHLIGKHATTEIEVKQSQNLSYVGVTRAQETLTFITSSQIDELGE